MNFTLDTIAGILSILFGIIVIYWAIKDGDDKGFDYKHFRTISGGLLAVFLGIILLLKFVSFFDK
jgi:hypothetical protein